MRQRDSERERERKGVRESALLKQADMDSVRGRLGCDLLLRVLHPGCWEKIRISSSTAPLLWLLFIGADPARDEVRFSYYC